MTKTSTNIGGVIHDFTDISTNIGGVIHGFDKLSTNVGGVAKDIFVKEDNRFVLVGEGLTNDFLFTNQKIPLNATCAFATNLIECNTITAGTDSMINICSPLTTNIGLDCTQYSKITIGVTVYSESSTSISIPIRIWLKNSWTTGNIYSVSSGVICGWQNQSMTFDLPAMINVQYLFLKLSANNHLHVYINNITFHN